MSLATFKKKSINSKASATKISGKPPGGFWGVEAAYGPQGFSLNGGTRSISVGQSMAMSQNGARFKGVYPVGHGGDRGRYATPVPTYNMPAVKAFVEGNQYKYVKPSVLSTKGMLTKRYPWIQNGQYPCSVTQPMYTGYQTDTASQGVYLSNLSAKADTVQDVNDSAKYVGLVACGGPNGCERTSMHGYTYNTVASNAPYSKQTKNPRDQSTNLLRVKQQCVNPTAAQKPFPGPVNSGVGLLRGGIDGYAVGYVCNAAAVVVVPP